jgi:NTP pyrophosphatase (non-canonical NTP hydrolase)
MTGKENRDYKAKSKYSEDTMQQETIDRIRKFTEERDWQQFHTPANLAKSISIEANELLECFQWSDTEYDIAHVREELADVLVYCRNMLDELGLDEDEIVNEKMEKNEAKYPVEKARGKADKYDRLV